MSLSLSNLHVVFIPGLAKTREFDKILAISENYPDLKASEQFIGLQDELAGTENRIAVARQYYNEKVNSYNRKVQRFPTSIVAGMSGYYPMQYFEADESAKEVPKVDFN